MSIIKGVLKEERSRLKKLAIKYKNEIKKYPKGAVSVKKKGKYSYMYLAYRQEVKIHFKYIGKMSSNQVQELMQQVKLRKKYESLLRKVKGNLKEIDKSI